MRIGVPTEIKVDEHRVALTPGAVRELVDASHTVVVQAGAGAGSRHPDSRYVDAGAQLAPSAREVFSASDLIIKVKEPLAEEVRLLEPRHTLFTFLHLAPDPKLTQGLIDSGAICIAYETVECARGRLPLLAPMSEIAGRLAAQASAFALERTLGGLGKLLGGVPGVRPSRVKVIGGGVAGMNAASVALGMGANVTVFDRSLDRLRELDAVFAGRADLCFSSRLAIEEQLPEADVVIGAVLIPGARTPRLVSRKDLCLLQEGAALVDISIDQGGCFETSRPTTLSDPTFVLDGVVHYCAANMPGAVPVTSTQALGDATLPYLLHLANEGIAEALRSDEGLRKGLNVAAGEVTLEPIARSQGREWTPPEEVVKQISMI